MAASSNAAGYSVVPQKGAAADYNTNHHHDPDDDHYLALALTPSPILPPSTHTPLSATFDDLDDPDSNREVSPRITTSITDVLKSLTGSQRSTQSYELVEEDDYEQSQITPRLPKKMGEMMGYAAAGSTSPREDAPVRTASISRHLPLHNPTPDLQSLQGAYVKNVQALEDSAERISLAGSIEEELQRMRSDLHRSGSQGSLSASDGLYRKFSSTSMSNSIIGVNANARSGGYSPAAGFITSPVGSVRSGGRGSQRAARTSRASNLSITLPEPELEGRPLESAMVHSPPAHAMQLRNSSESQRSIDRSPIDRPGTSASNDTYRQAQNLFTDFDGIHYAPSTDDDRSSRRMSRAHPQISRQSKVYSEEQPDQKTVYYPAPVPVMLNLPKRLSRHNWAQQEKRRTIALETIPQENRKSAAWLANPETDAEFDPDVERPRNNRNSTLPPQLRASAFFDAPGQRSTVQLKHGSAVMTLDNILDAAAHAPVSAFTDHPIAGNIATDIYGHEPGVKKRSSEIKQKRRSSLSNLLNKRKSSATLSNSRRMSRNLDDELEVDDDDPEKAAERSIAPGEDELSDNDRASDDRSGSEESEDDEPDQQHQLGFSGAPTTLLAELQMRKAQQKLRNRTAANAFPTGMHSTLLELDAVTQLQQRSRRQKHVALAWEDQEAVDRANYDDEDVPLGVLFPEKEKQNHVNFNKPLGLMEKRELEENEPLSFRRARLRGEPYRPSVPEGSPSQTHEDAPSAPVLKLRGVDDDEEEGGEEETLAQRRQRMQEKKDKRASLADDIASQLGLELDASNTNQTPGPEQEETLGQRRKRLQAEADKAGKSIRQKTSMGDLLRTNPAGNHNDQRQASAESKVSLLMNRRDPSVPLIHQVQAAQPGSKPIPSPNAAANPPPYFPNQPLLQQHQQQQVQQQMRQSAMPNMGYPMPQVQSMPNLNMMNMNYVPVQQNPYMQQSNPSFMNFTVPNMMMPPMQMNMNTGMPMPMAGYPSPAIAPAYDHIGMGPPLTPQQRTNIDRWRQGIA